MNVSVSIITPTYNRAHTIQKAIDSVLKQTYQDWEMIIVDDGSTDNTEEIVKKSKDPRIKYLNTLSICPMSVIYHSIEH